MGKACAEIPLDIAAVASSSSHAQPFSGATEKRKPCSDAFDNGKHRTDASENFIIYGEEEEHVDIEPDMMDTTYESIRSRLSSEQLYDACKEWSAKVSVQLTEEKEDLWREHAAME